ncbi:MAG: hypothetical protein HZC42_09015 [Candidatus Eisenbacteria bacterium]|nr:hypothetical protein [Candidatus Eisenbacteria bacterium]
MQLLLCFFLAASAAPPETLVVPLQGIVVTGTRTPQAASIAAEARARSARTAASAS